jgi:hypothetical protein
MGHHFAQMGHKMGHHSVQMGHHFAQMGHQMGHHSAPMGHHFAKMGHEGTPTDIKMVSVAAMVKRQANKGLSTRFLGAEWPKNQVTVPKADRIFEAVGTLRGGFEARGGVDRRARAWQGN